MSHKDAPPETPSQVACRQWWTNAQPHITRAWGRAKDRNFLAEESRLLHESWEAALSSQPQTLDSLAEAMAVGFPIAAIVRALNKAAPGIAGAFAPPADCAQSQPPSAPVGVEGLAEMWKREAAELVRNARDARARGAATVDDFARADRLDAKADGLHEAAADLLALAQQPAAVPEKRAPVQGHHGKTIPWSVHGLAWEAYAKEYGRAQSAERIAERGGFGTGEMDRLLPGWRDMAEGRQQPAAVDEAMERLRACPKLWHSDLVGDQISQLRMRAIVTAALAQQPAAVDGAPTYRLLSSADEIRADDEFLGDDTVTWLPVGKEFLSASMCGKKYNPAFLQPMRRAIAALAQPQGEG